MQYSGPGNVVNLSFEYSYVSGRFDRETNILYSTIWEYYVSCTKVTDILEHDVNHTGINSVN